MGWFDNEQDAENRPPGAAPQPGSPRPAAPRAASSGSGSDSGSTLGREIHVDGTIVCDEDLTILGKVDGTIRAKGTLVVATDADVHAKIDGQRVVVHGKVDGNVQGAELVVVGQTGHLTGNIQTPTLEIVEGAHFKGSVDMTAVAKPEPAKVQTKTPDGKSVTSEASSSGGDSDKKPKSAMGGTGEGSPAKQKHGHS